MRLELSDRRRSHWGYQCAVLTFGSLRSLVRLVPYAGEMDLRFAGRAVLIYASSALTWPLRAWESLRFGRALRRTRIHPAPVFILGHWRSGTTHLHNLMSQDPALGYVPMYQAILPECSLVAERWLRPLLARLVPLVRPMDNMIWPLDHPQEEEVPLSKTFHLGFYTKLLFPGSLRESFERLVLLRGSSDADRALFKRRYLRVLRKATLRAQGRRLVLKNPVNTGRIRYLLELFPDAKFVYIHRDPYEVFVSTRHLHRKLLEVIRLQDTNDEEIERNVLSIYRMLQRRYLEERSLIPSHQLVEVTYEDLSGDPMGCLKRIYQELSLPGFAVAEPSFQAYVNSQAEYKRNEYFLDDETVLEVNRSWGFAFAEFGYRLRDL